jgi:energy-coupling factor transporter ATP-binding protein EcfA2
MEAVARDQLERVGLGGRHQERVDTMGMAERQLVEIAKALMGEVSVLLFDEPTSALSDPEARRLFGLIDTLTASGVAVIYVSHRLNEILHLSHRISVLRDGRLRRRGLCGQWFIRRAAAGSHRGHPQLRPVAGAARPLPAGHRLAAGDPAPPGQAAGGAAPPHRRRVSPRDGGVDRHREPDPDGALAAARGDLLDKMLHRGLHDGGERRGPQAHRQHREGSHQAQHPAAPRRRAAAPCQSRWNTRADKRFL